MKPSLNLSVPLVYLIESPTHKIVCVKH